MQCMTTTSEPTLDMQHVSIEFGHTTFVLQTDTRARPRPISSLNFVETYGNWGQEAKQSFSRLASRLATDSSQPKLLLTSMDV